jgi:hypothetical protein
MLPTILVGCDLGIAYLTNAKQQYTVYSLSGELTPHFLCKVSTPPDLPAPGVLPTTQGTEKAELLTNRTKPSKVETPLIR